MPPINAVVFDLGGTLIEYAGSYTSWPELETPGFTAAYETLHTAGVQLPPFAEFRAAGFALLPRRWRQATAAERNLRLVDLLAEALHAVNVTGVSEAQLAKAGRQYETAVCQQAWLQPHAAETVQAVKEAGYRVGLLSNTMFTGAAHRADLARFGLLDYFDALLFSADAGQWKPNAAPFLTLLDELGVEPETAVYVGDDPANDVVGGQNAGMRTIYIKANSRFTTPNGVKPDAQINRLPELIEILRNWGTNESV